MTVLSFSDGYKKYFEVVPAISEELKRHNFRLRHEVYCRDLGFEPENAEGIEHDRFDRHSAHCLIRSRASNAYVGCARMVMVDPLAPEQPLPFESACAGALDRSIIDVARLQRSRIAEVSRLAILGRYRRRKGETRQPFAMDCEFGTGTHLRLPYLPVAMYLALLALAHQHGIEYLFILTEPRLAASITRFGVRVRQIGSPIAFRGTRVPSMMVVEEIIADMNDYVRPFFDTIAEEISGSLAAGGAEAAVSAAALRRA